MNRCSNLFYVFNDYLCSIISSSVATCIKFQHLWVVCIILFIQDKICKIL